MLYATAFDTKALMDAVAAVPWPRQHPRPRTLSLSSPTVMREGFRCTLRAGIMSLTASDSTPEASVRAAVTAWIELLLVTNRGLDAEIGHELVKNIDRRVTN